ncbi:MAG TPA: response regulator [Anaerolineae bacterium]
MKEHTIHILLVEDELTHVELLRRAFEAQPEAARLTVAHTLQEAQDHLARAHPDLIITDLRLPDGDGSELLPANPDEAVYPLIILTSHGSEEVAVEVMKAGALDYVVKSEAAFAAMPRIVERVLKGWSHFVERKQAELELAARARQQAVVAQLGQRALTGLDLSTLLDEITTLIAETLELELSKILEHLPEDNVFLLRAGVGWQAGLVGHATVDGGADSQAGFTLLTDEPIIVEDFRTETRFSGPAILHDHGVISGISVIIAGQKNRPFGVLGAHTTQRRTFTRDDVHFLQAVANVLATAIERKWAEEALRESEERYRSLFDNAQEAILMADDEGRYVEANQAACDLFGYSREEFLQMSVRDLVPPPRRESSKVGWQAFIAAGLAKGEYELMRKDGTIIETEHQAAANIISGLHLAMIRDISERKQAEKAIQQRNRELALLNRVIAASAASLDPEAILETVCRELALAFEVPRATAALLDREQTVATIVAQYVSDGAPLLMNQVIPVADVPSFQYVIELKEPLAIPDAQNDPRMATVKPMLRERGVISFLIIPFIVEDQVAGGMGLGTLERRHFSPQEMRLAKSVADQVAGALARVQLEEERRRLAAEYQQAQKLEAVGQLAAGIAHDFNNLLTAINGFAELLYLNMTPTDPNRESIGKILQSGQRAADLVSQLLAFSRKHVIRPQVIDLNKIVTEMDKMLRHIIREDISLEIALAPGLWPIKVDPAQMEQVIINLAVNACDAMLQGGRLSIETANIVLDIDQTDYHLGLQPGDHIVLTINDTGHGMSEKVRSHIFEPFFTTKEVGKGTGLGLASVFSIIKQNQGNIEVLSTEGIGTAFKIYLPRTQETSSLPRHPAPKTEIPAGNQTILVAEDNAEVRELTQRALQEHGYTLLRAQNGEEALALAARHPGPIHLLLTDVVMPGMNGQTLAKQLVRMYPDLKVLYMSGYTDEAIATNGVLDPDVIFLQKPFSPNTLALKVRAILGADLEDLNSAYEDRQER